ncbi:MAG: holo-ACP synthase [Bdellovibrionota bacterium]
MKILGHGIDLVSIARIRAILEKSGGDHFEKRVFSEGERAYCRARKDPMPHFAARFAAKEAYGKALGLGLGPSGEFAEIEVTSAESGAPAIRLTGKAAEIFQAHGGGEIFLSLTHEGDQAMASVIVTRKS